jgi:hypothetical protein
MTGIFHNLSFEDYCADPAVNQSILKMFLDVTPADVKSHREEERGRPSDCLRVGTIEHYLLLQPEEFPRMVVTRPALWADWKTSASKAWRKEQELAGRIVVTEKELVNIHGMHDAVRAHRISGPLFRRGSAEVSLFAHDPEVGLDLKTRIDWLPDPSLIVDGPVPTLDLKTADDVHPDRFRRTIRQRRYYFQAFVNLRLCTLLGLERSCALICAVKSEPPFTVEISQIGARWLEQAHGEYLAVCRIYKECIESGVWPGSTNTINVVEPD